MISGGGALLLLVVKWEDLKQDICCLATYYASHRITTSSKQFIICIIPFNAHHRILPLKKLWPWLAAVACQHTGCRRLQTIKLLMELLHMQQLPTTYVIVYL